MKTENLNTKLTTDLSEDNIDTNNKILNLKSKTFQITTFILLFIGISTISFLLLSKKLEPIKPIILEEEVESLESNLELSLDHIYKGNWIDATFKITDISYPTRLLGAYKINETDVDIYVNGMRIKPEKSSAVDPQLTYKFSKAGTYNVKYHFKKTLTTMERLFINNRDVVSVSFLPGFDSSQVTSMENMFTSSYIQSIDMKYLNTEKLQNLRAFININNYKYNYKTKKIIDNPVIDISSFDTSQVTNCAGMLHELHDDVTIIISNKLTKCREQIPYFNKIINIDEEACPRLFKNCKNCVGSHEKLRCGECDERYKLMKNGFCKKIENYFVATYNVTSTTKPVHFLNLDEKNMTINDFDLFINGKKVQQVEHYEMIYGTGHYFLSYTFKHLGLQEVKIAFKSTPRNMRQLFYLCFDLVKIKFSDTFDTSKVQTMAYTFAKCTSLKSIDVSSFDTRNVGDFMQTFQYCSELTSLDLSNFNTTNVFLFQSTFDSMTNLKYLDISSFNCPYCPNGYYINHAGKGAETTVILNRKFRALYFPSDWKKVYKD